MGGFHKDRTDSYRPFVCFPFVTGSIIDFLNRGEEIELRGFGSFRIRERAARVGRNPRSGESVKVPPKTIPPFQARETP